MLRVINIWNHTLKQPDKDFKILLRDLNTQNNNIVVDLVFCRVSLFIILGVVVLFKPLQTVTFSSCLLRTIKVQVPCFDQFLVQSELHNGGTVISLFFHHTTASQVNRHDSCKVTILSLRRFQQFQELTSRIFTGICKTSQDIQLLGFE